jgi:AraC-like DNA-binding protein
VVAGDGRSARRFSGHCGSLNFCTRLPATDSCLTLMIQLSKPRTSDYGRFSRAVALLQLIAHDLESALETVRWRNEAKRLSDRLQQILVEEHRLRGELHERFPELPEEDPERANRSHSQELVNTMQTYVLAHYHRPLQLGDVAAALRMNPSYLSALFSRTTGVTFHRYLEEVRLARAKEMLANPANRVCEVACSVGYASASQFRHMFKQRTGVAPHLWHGAP